KVVSGSMNQTYADILDKIFVDTNVHGSSGKYFPWNAADLDRIKALNPALSVADFVIPSSPRPFLIVGGSMIYVHPAYDYPGLVPVEMTPLYVGVRQRFGARIGGAYVSPFAYDVASAGAVRDGTVRVRPAAGVRPLSLADMIAASGAAPLLFLSRGRPVKAAARLADFFPAVNHHPGRAPEPGAVGATGAHGGGPAAHDA